MFVRRAGTVILVSSVILWALERFPRDDAAEERLAPQITAAEADVESKTKAVEALSETQLASSAGEQAVIRRNDALTEQGKLERELAQAHLRASAAGTIGRTVEPVVAPLGFDWRIGIGLVSSLAAREVLVSSLGTVFAAEAGNDEEYVPLREALLDAKDENGQPAYRPLTAISLLVFFVLACQCISTVAVMRRETASWRWPIFMFVYMTVLAWGASFLVWQVGNWWGF